jgi:hypothetical protein
MNSGVEAKLLSAITTGDGLVKGIKKSSIQLQLELTWLMDKD